ncbi:hypothetical protein [Actinomadura miaoliensis]|uniref:DUF4297 domain-containing protein n=1 Tax=Actinomadura miaoliensis TaxID=430685 RepID=A0ABP7WTP3_9ACTN
MTATRVAGPTIKGYAYQFDQTIIAILDAETTNGTVVIEGCEDIDIHTDGGIEAVQCKYHEERSFSLVGLRKVLLPMLHSLTEGKDYDYRLYAHYSDNVDVPHRLNVEQIKQALTEKKRNPPEVVRHFLQFTPEILEKFSQQFSINCGPSFEEQRRALISALAKRFRGTLDDARDLYYGNALSLVMELAIAKDPKDRIVSPRSFLDQINKRDPLFSRWQEEILGRAQVLQAIKKKLKATAALKTTKWRALALSASSFDVNELSEMAYFLATEQFGQGYLANAQPWTLIIDGSSQQVEAVKTALIEENIWFNDGYEHLVFNPAIFNQRPVINLDPKRRDHIGLHSYGIRVISAETYAKFASDIENLHTLLSVGNLYSFDHAQVGGQRFHLHTADVSDLKQLLIEGRPR